MKEHLDTWRAPVGRAALRDDEVHVWRVGLEESGARLERLWRLLDAEERRRAERYHFERDRRHFIVARGTLRRLLGDYLDLAPESLRFSYSAYGKPALEDEARAVAPDLRFNLSHSGALALYVFARGRELGIDIERMREDFDLQELAARFFSAAESRALLELPAGLRTRAFFNCWTRKEAYVKARGEGLSHPLDTFCVSLVPGSAAALVETRNDPRETARWRLHDLAPAPDYAAALAIEAGHGPLLRFAL